MVTTPLERLVRSSQVDPRTTPGSPVLGCPTAAAADGTPVPSRTVDDTRIVTAERQRMTDHRTLTATG